MNQLLRDLESVNTFIDENNVLMIEQYNNIVYRINELLELEKDKEIKNKLLITFKTKTDYVALFLPTQDERTKFERIRDKDLIKMRKVAWGY